MDHASAAGAAACASTRPVSARVIGGIDESELHLLVRRMMQDAMETELLRLGGFESRLRQGFISVDERLEAMGLRLQQKVDVSMLESHTSKAEMGLSRKLDVLDRRISDAEESRSNQSHLLNTEIRQLMERLEDLTSCVRLKADADHVSSRLAALREEEATGHKELQNAMTNLRHGLLEELEARAHSTSEQLALKADITALENVTSELQDLRELSKSIQSEAASIQGRSTQFWESSQKRLDGKIEGLERRFDDLRATLKGCEHQLSEKAGISEVRSLADDLTSQLAHKAPSSEIENRFEGVTCQLAKKAEISDIDNRFEEITRVGKSALANKIWGLEKHVSSLEGAIAASLPTGGGAISHGSPRSAVATDRAKPRLLRANDQGAASPLMSDASTPTNTALSPAGQLRPGHVVMRQDFPGGMVRSSSVPGLQARNRVSPTREASQFFHVQALGNSPNSGSPLSPQGAPIASRQSPQIGGYPQGPLGAAAPASNRPGCGLGALWR